MACKVCIKPEEVWVEGAHVDGRDGDIMRTGVLVGEEKAATWELGGSPEGLQ